VAERGALDVRDVGATLGRFRAIDGVSFSIPAGGRHGVIGPNGAGKSTLFNVLSGYVRDTNGRVELDGESLLGRRPDRIVKSGMLRTFQSPAVLAEWRVDDIVRLAAEQGSAGARSSEVVSRSIDDVGLDDRRATRAGALNMLQRRRLALATCLAHEPAVLLLDEPTAGLDDAETKEFAALLGRLHESYAFTVALVEHKLSFLMNFCESITVLDAGKVIASGSPQHVAADPVVIEAYLGTEGTHD
jgi:branched-chain amino acid transport system ATP-binding protein